MEKQKNQVLNGDIYDLTELGIKEINSHENDYNEISSPIKSTDRNWHTKDI